MRRSDGYEVALLEKKQAETPVAFSIDRTSMKKILAHAQGPLLIEARDEILTPSPNRLELSFLSVFAFPKASSSVLLRSRVASIVFAVAPTAVAGVG